VVAPIVRLLTGEIGSRQTLSRGRRPGEQRVGCRRLETMPSSNSRPWLALMAIFEAQLSCPSSRFRCAAPTFTTATPPRGSLARRS